MKTKIFSGEEFIMAMKSGDVKSNIMKVGMIKLSESIKEEILFAPGNNCKSWITIPLYLIEQIEMLYEITCNGIRYPYIKLYLKELEPDNVSARVFSALLNASTQPCDAPLLISALHAD